MELVRYLRIAVYTGLFAIPFVGLIVADSFFFPFITGKNFSFRILVEAVFAVWLVLALISKEDRPQWSLATILGALFVVAIGVSTIFAENPAKAFWSNFERMEGYITVLHLALYVTVLTAALRTEMLWRRFFNTSIIAASLVGAYAVLQLFGFFTINQGGVRIDATFGNATYLAVYMLIHAFLALVGVFRWSNGSRWLQSLYGAAFILFGALVFYSATRGTILGLVGGLFLTGLIIALSHSGKVRKFGIGLVIVVGIMVGIFFAVKGTDFVKNHEILSRIASISLSEGATRFQIWNMAIEGFKDRPVFGWGQEGFNYVFNKYYTPSLYAQEPWFDRAHNVLLDWLIAGGLVGALLYMSLYAVLIYYLWRPGNTFDATERALLTSLLAGYAFHNIFVFDNLMSYIMFGAIFSYITVRAVPPKSWGEPIPESIHAIAGGTVIVASFILFYFMNVPGMTSASDLIEGIRPQSTGIETNLQHFVDAGNRGGLGKQEVGEQFLQFAIQVKSVGIGDQAFQLKVANAARDNFLKVLQSTPNDARLQVFFGSFLRQFNDFAGAEERLKAALTLSPQKQGIKFELGTLYLNAGKYDQALAVLKEAYESEPNYALAQSAYASAAILAGKTDLAHELLIKRYGTDLPDDVSILQSYIQARDFVHAIALAEARSNSDPKNIQKLTQLAGVYLEAKQKDRAIATLRMAIDIDPTFKEQGNKYIEQIQAGTI